MSKPTKIMIAHLNLKLKEEDTCLRYIEKQRDGNITTYELQVVDKYIDNTQYGMSLNLTKDFENKIRRFFKKYGIEDTGYSNTIATLLVVD